MEYEDGEAYDQDTQGPYYDLWFEMLEHFLDLYLPEDGKLLDAGGGTAEFTVRAANLRKRLTCVNLDISQSMLEQAERKIREHELQTRIKNELGDIQHIQYPDESFDYVMCLGDAISFCTDVDKAFTELVRVTKPMGQIHVSVNSFWGNYFAMYKHDSDLEVSFDDVRKYMETRIIYINGQSSGCRSFTLQELLGWAKTHRLKVVAKFAAPIFPFSDDWMAEDSIASEIRALQYEYCDKENIMEFGNHLNVIYRKEITPA
ncbi:MAG: methyltransferase domain-containing protein [Candidatus Aegiribacteria sp.]|nr:methyltransferase domain-containing protein [Candidatus Aegiribacteria sp.]